MSRDDDVRSGVSQVRERIVAACARAGRSAAEVTLVAASKTRSPEDVLAALAAGVTDFGENRPEEALPKIEAVGAALAGRPLPAPIWHMIGHVQSRKAPMVVGPYTLLHSLDSERLAQKLSFLAEARRERLPVLLEVNIGGEKEKYGFSAPAGAQAALDAFAAALGPIVDLPGLAVRGLMAMAPLTETPEQARPYFRALRDLRDQLSARFTTCDWSQLSMGMTDDFEVAIEEGATLVRVGRAIFGARPAL